MSPVCVKQVAELVVATTSGGESETVTFFYIKWSGWSRIVILCFWLWAQEMVSSDK